MTLNTSVAQSDLAGWSLSGHHVYDPIGWTLYLGNGRKRTTERLGNVISSVPGTDVILEKVAVGPDGTLYFSDFLHRVYRRLPNGTVDMFAGTGESGFSGDGGPANQATLAYPSGVAVGPDGSVYIADAGNARIRKVTPQGVITTVAGNGTTGSTGDGGPAINAQISARNLAVGMDGSLYLSEEYGRIRKVALDGMIISVAGTGELGTSGDGGPALSARVSPRGIALSKDGTIYFADDQTVRKVTVDGMIYRVAGNPDSTTLGDGGPALNAALGYPDGIALGEDGSVYVADYYDNRIRRIGPEGRITTYAGNGEESFNFVILPNGDGGPAATAVVSLPTGLAIGPDGAVYVCDNPGYAMAFNSPGMDPTASRVRRIGTQFPGLQLAETAIASEDGGALDVFDFSGRHLRTEDALSRITLFQFAYDSTSRLSSVRDRDSLVTRIERDSAGTPTAVVGPFGQRTTFTVDTTGYINSITNSAGETESFGFSAGGMMTGRLNPRGYVHTYTFDSLGLLIRDQDHLGGYTSLSRTDLGNPGDFEVLVTTAEGRKTKYRVERLVTGEIRYTNTDGTGLATISTSKPDGTITSVGPDSVATTTVQEPDPLYAMHSPLGSRTIRTPSGLTAHIAQTRTVTEISGSQLTEITENTTFNGRTSSVVFNGEDRTIVSTSPQGRVTFSILDSLGRTVLDSIPGVFPVQYFYDPQGFLTSVTQGDRTTIFEYNGRGLLFRVTDPANRTSSMYYDSVGRVTRQVLADGREVLYTYDAAGNLTSLTPPGRPAHAFEYTPVDLTHKYSPPEILPDTVWETAYAYNLDRQLTRTLLPEGDSIAVRYDTTGCSCGSLARPAEITFDRGSLGFAYDAVTGTLTRITSPGADTLFFTYDGSLPLSARWGGTVNGTVSVEYDSSFRVVAQRVNGTESVAFSYDGDGLLQSAGVLHLRRDGANGLFLGDTLGSIVTSVGYNGYGEMSSYQARYGGTTLFATGYERDSLGRIRTLTETIGGVTTEHGYGYDLAGRLNEVWRNDTLQATYYYDPNGNRDSVVTPGGTTEGTYDAQDRMVTYGGGSYFYTKRGSLSMKVEGVDTTRYTYDLMGNLTRVDLPTGDVIEYLIDGENRRVGKRLNGQTVARWVYAGQLSPVAELDSAGAVVARYVYASHVNVPDYMVKEGVTYRIVTDHLGSVRLVVNQSTGSIVQRMDYDAWGNVTFDSNVGFTPFGFAGGLYEPETQLVRFGARDYEATVGRWTNRDPILFGGLLSNLYEYVADNPCNNIDVEGLVPGYRSIFGRQAPGVFEAGALALLGPPAMGIVGYSSVVASKTAEATGLAGREGGPQDAYRHCLWSCMMAKGGGAGFSYSIGIIHEIQGVLDALTDALLKGCWKSISPKILKMNQQDLHNNFEGIRCAKSPDGCQSECMKAIRDKRLQVK